jgi:hypothetical protein
VHQFGLPSEVVILVAGLMVGAGLFVVQWTWRHRATVTADIARD